MARHWRNPSHSHTTLVRWLVGGAVVLAALVLLSRRVI
jgi:hypothetical protein